MNFLDSALNLGKRQARSIPITSIVKEKHEQKAFFHRKGQHEDKTQSHKHGKHRGKDGLLAISKARFNGHLSLMRMSWARVNLKVVEQCSAKLQETDVKTTSLENKLIPNYVGRTK
ncbi:unnamed protein product [Dovyalis caffra]|uniref:Uncharacterized protein n=1 Tax=Dovyalis caffra TaxID=77055 RepID=A0AAV1SLW6_9ROSI|nr:unnamed protein product [Dovyalis caffra]